MVDMPVMRVLITDDAHPVLAQRLVAAGFDVVTDTGYSYERLLAEADSYDAIVVRSKVSIDRAFIDQCHRLKVIARVGAGMETIDVDYAGQRGITCLNSPEGNRDAVGEHTLGLLLSLFDHISKADSEVRRGLWLREPNRGVEVKGKNIGIIGYGNMGRAFAQRLAGFECQVFVYDVKGTRASGFENPLPYVRNVSLEQLEQAADVVSLHVPLLDSTRYLVDEAFISAFAKPFYLINTSRGLVVRTSAVAEGLRNGKILGAALDVVEYENMAKDGIGTFPDDFHFLQQNARTVLTPHVAGWTAESKYRLASVLADKIIDALTKRLTL